MWPVGEINKQKHTVSWQPVAEVGCVLLCAGCPIPVLQLTESQTLEPGGSPAGDSQCGQHEEGRAERNRRRRKPGAKASQVEKHGFSSHLWAKAVMRKSNVVPSIAEGQPKAARVTSFPTHGALLARLHPLLQLQAGEGRADGAEQEPDTVEKGESSRNYLVEKRQPRQDLITVSGDLKGCYIERSDQLASLCSEQGLKK